MKRTKDQANTKLKMADTRKKLYNFIAQIQSFNSVAPEKQKSSVGRTVKEMTDYFENMSKPIKEIENLEARSIKALPITPSLIPIIRNSNILTNTPIMMNRTPTDLNLHSVWKDSKLYGHGFYKSEISRPNIMESIKHSLKSSVWNCVLMMQYI